MMVGFAEGCFEKRGLALKMPRVALRAGLSGWIRI